MTNSPQADLTASLLNLWHSCIRIDSYLRIHNLLEFLTIPLRFLYNFRSGWRCLLWQAGHQKLLCYCNSYQQIPSCTLRWEEELELRTTFATPLNRILQELHRPRMSLRSWTVVSTTRV